MPFGANVALGRLWGGFAEAWEALGDSGRLWGRLWGGFGRLGGALGDVGGVFGKSLGGFGKLWGGFQSLSSPHAFVSSPIYKKKSNSRSTTLAAPYYI